MGEVRPPVALLRTVVRERVGAEIIQQWRRPPGKFQGVDLVDTQDETRPRFPAGRKPGTVRSLKDRTAHTPEGPR